MPKPWMIMVLPTNMAPHRISRREMTYIVTSGTAFTFWRCKLSTTRNLSRALVGDYWFLYFTNSISLGRHFLVKNGSSGL